MRESSPTGAKKFPSLTLAPCKTGADTGTALLFASLANDRFDAVSVADPCGVAACPVAACLPRASGTMPLPEVALFGRDATASGRPPLRTLEGVPSALALRRNEPSVAALYRR